MELLMIDQADKRKQRYWSLDQDSEEAGAVRYAKNITLKRQRVCPPPPPRNTETLTKPGRILGHKEVSICF